MFRIALLLVAVSASFALAAPPRDLKESLNRIFKECDANADGKIDADELVTLQTRVTTRVLTGPELRKHGKVRVPDEDAEAAKDAKAGGEERDRPVRIQLKQHVADTNPDADGDGFVTVGEFSAFSDDVLAKRQELIAAAEALVKPRVALEPVGVGGGVGRGDRADRDERRELEEDRDRLADQRRELETQERREGRMLAAERERLAREEQRLQELENAINNPPPMNEVPEPDGRSERNPKPRPEPRPDRPKVSEGLREFFDAGNSGNRSVDPRERPRAEPQRQERPQPQRQERPQPQRQERPQPQRQERAEPRTRQERPEPRKQDRPEPKRDESRKFNSKGK